MAKKTPLQALRTLSRIMTLGVVGLIAYLLLHLLPGGWGESGNGREDSETETLVSHDGRSTPVVPALDASSSTDEVSRDALTGQERAALAGGILTLLIEERDYFLAVPRADGWEYSPLPLSRARELAVRAAGDSNGIRVRILRRASSRASAEYELMQELQEAGLDSDAIFMSSQFEPSN